MAMLAGAFASCSKEDISRSPGTEGTQSVTINLVADDAVNTRAAATGLSQYIIEVYSDAAYTTPENIFGEGATNQATSANGSFSLILDRTKEYYCLFWADKDAAAYTTATLKTVTLAPGTAPAEAWFGTQQISGNQPTQTITLKRAVAKLNLLETGKLIAGTTLTATFDQPTVFNVATGEVTNALAARTETITLESTISGSKETPVQLGTDYFILCPASTQYVATVTFRCGEEEAFDVDNVPFQANRATNIKGHYTSLASETFNVTCDADWNATDGELYGPVITALEPDALSWVWNNAFSQHIEVRGWGISGKLSCTLSGGRDSKFTAAVLETTVTVLPIGGNYTADDFIETLTVTAAGGNSMTVTLKQQARGGSSN